MKDTEIHNGLENQIMRDTISLNLSLREGENYKVDYSTYDYNFENTELILWKIQNFDKQIIHIKKLKQFFSDKLAWVTLMNNYGWQEYDVSDVADRINYDVNWKPFIGTEQEYEKFIEQFEK